MEAKRALGKPQSFGTKFLTGFILLAVLIIVIWFPLLLMSALQAQGQPNVPVMVSVTVTINVFQPIFAMSALQFGHVSPTQYDELLRHDSSGFLATFQPAVSLFYLYWSIF